MTLSTQYLGLDLRTPFIVGASPLCDDVAMARRLEEAGAGALVMRSLFEEQLAPRAAGAGDEAFLPDAYVAQIERLKRAVSIPVIASLNGSGPGAWAGCASRLEAAGADAIELNFYRVVTDVTVAADAIEAGMLETVRLVTGAVRVPVTVKLSPFHTAVAQLAVALELAGAAGVVVFNRFYQPDVNPTTLAVQPQLRLSEPGEALLRLRWLAILSPQLRGSLAATGGFHTAEDVAKAVLSGAHAVQLVSVLLRHGAPALAALATGLRRWMETQGLQSPAEFRGRLNLRDCPDPAAYERANYRETLQNWTV